MMLSDQWMKDPNIHKSEPIEINDVVFLKEWRDKDDELVGVTVSFEYANDFHIELTAANRQRFIDIKLKGKPGNDVIEQFRSYFTNSHEGSQFEGDLMWLLIPYKFVFF